jgi:hypothetical protein
LIEKGDTMANRFVAILLIGFISTGSHWTPMATAKDSDQASSLPEVDCGFPGGNIIVDAIDGDTIRLHQDLRDTRGDWFYWYFRVRGAAGRTLTFQFPRKDVIGVRGPAVSLDGGDSWTWLGTTAVNDTSFRYTFPPDADEVRFCFAIPYVESNLRKFLKTYDGHPNLKVGTLCETRKGRKVELLYLGRLDGRCDHRILITCRHHACEMIANYVLEGMIEEILADTENGKWLREHVEFLMIPFVDKDGVEDGDQGKNRRPHDHALDYARESIHPTVRAIKKLVPEWSEGHLRFSLDFHCPWIRGAKHEILVFPHLYRLRATGQVERAAAFLKILEAMQTGPLVFKADDSLRFTGWDDKTPYEKSAWVGPPRPVPPRSISLWVKNLPGVHFANSLEIPYANVSGKTVTVESARACGKDLARATRRYLENYGQTEKQGPTISPIEASGER